MTAATGPVILGDRPTGAGSEAPPYLAAYASVPPHWVAAASVLGQRHARRGRPRDDALAVRAGGGRLVVVAADGVGAAPLARHGAACVGAALAAALTRHPWEAGPGLGAPGSPAARGWRGALLRLARRQAAPAVPPPAFEAPGAGSAPSGTLAWWPAEAPPPEPAAPQADLAIAVRAAYREARASLCARASELGCDLGDLATTGLLVAVQGGLVAAGQLGDGALLGLTRAGALHLLVPPPEQPDPRWTAAVSDEDWEAQLEVHVWDRPGDPFVLLLVMTDGVAQDVLRAGLPAARDWTGALAATLRAAAGPEQAAARLAAWLAAYRVRGSWDDRTLAAIVRQEAPVVVTIENGNQGVPGQITLPEQTPRVGGEGAVYFADGYAVKLYHEWDAAAVARLLSIQRLGRGARPGQPLTWPIGLVAAVDGRAALGAVFYRLPERFVPLYRLVYSRDWADKFLSRGATWGGHLLWLAWGVANAVHRLHSSGAVHTDLHFKNILVDGWSGEVALVDLDGVAVGGQPAGPARGLPPFIAPEQELGDPTPARAKDRYALAVNLLWTLLLRNPAADGALGATGPADYGGALSVRALTPALQALAQRALGEGRLHPAARPLPSDWSAALADAGDAVVDCPRCRQRVIYPFWLSPAARRSCPFCGSRWPAPLPVVLAIGRPDPAGPERVGPDRAVRHLVLAPGDDLRLSAFGPGRHPPFGRASDPVIGRLCGAGRVPRLVNLGPEPWRAWPGVGLVTPGASVELNPGTRLRAARGLVTLSVVD